jgi:hypothetical protein
VKGFSNQVKIGTLRADSIGGRNGSFATVCTNARGHKGGLEGYAPDIWPFPAIYTPGGVLIDTAINWPFPQIFQTDSGLYLGNAVGLYHVEWSIANDRWEGTTLTSGYSSVITYPWTLADNPLFPVFASGDCLVYYDYDATAWAYYNKEHTIGTGGSRWHNDWYQPVSACAFRGQIFMVGSKIATTSPSQSRKIMWSEIGSFDFLGKTATARKNTAGFIFADRDDSEILMRCMPLLTGVMVYGGFSTIFMKPVDRPVATYSPRDVIDRGICCPLAVGGNEYKHLMVDTNGCAWMITPETRSETFDLKKLGYEEFLYPLVSDNLTLNVVYNGKEDEFYISDGTTGYMYNELGLTAISKMVTSFVDFTDKMLSTTDVSEIALKVYGFIDSTGEEHFLYESDILDMGLGGIKTIETVDIGINIDYNASLEVMVKWRNDKRSTFRDTTWKRCSPEGLCSPIVSGVEVKICVRVTPFTDLELNNITIRWKLSDKRAIRGMYASGAAAGSG